MNIDKLTDANLTDNTQIQVYEDPALGISTARKTTLGAIKGYYISGEGAPTISPSYIGQEYLDTDGNAWYKSYGLDSSDWQAL